MISLLNLQSDKVKYNPNHLFDTLIRRLHLKNDAALAKMLDVAPPVISKIRHLRLPIGASLMISMHEISGLTIKELRALMGDKRETFRITDSQLKSTLAKSRPKSKEQSMSHQY
ncbi:hypothetical protein UNDYM_1760 [Undibacterium sp. YM2]|uniref:hypothetical protein n=1 Tax=Undibacterium sp. YM2 TaxID=2058625 RepID=UPI001331E5AF|nr:hypothetical protein [Undibacterium sp. YM2]BBB66013.1 hypothetical protein UNDYM_1760 [Undibacterium sp. YM2]